MSARDIYIELEDASVDFPLLQAEHRSFKLLLSAPLRQSRFGTDGKRHVLHALRNVGLRLDHGDRVAVIGANGAGKSTLLRVLAGIYPPVYGSVSIEGRVCALLTTGLGMRDDSSGLENIEFGLLLQGVPPEQIPARRDAVAAFTELGEYLSLNVGAYSSGMRVRLAFAISTAVEPDILIIDEMFGAGDAAFMKKAEARMAELIANSAILVFASHTPALLEQFCNRALLLERGEVIMDGPVMDVHRRYMSSMNL
jgi:ABC-type polysaccharide/polyol phosphate transport system ATPase subunit